MEDESVGMSVEFVAAALQVFSFDIHRILMLCDDLLKQKITSQLFYVNSAVVCR